MNIEVFNTAREKVDSIDLNAEVFGAPVKEHLFHTVVRQQLANRRAGTHKVKGRSEVRGGGRKPFRQKGTGRARAGTIRAPHWRGGGVVFGPHPRNHGFNVPKKVRRAALRGAISKRVSEGAFTAFDKFQMDAIRTKDFKKVMDDFGFQKLVLVISEKDETVSRSARNIPGVVVLPVAGLNVYDVLRHANLAMTVDAIEAVVARLAK
jgi:large subunit ribosomal protein L4